jgi:subtilisin-like proprotein convertase family protein
MRTGLALLSVMLLCGASASAQVVSYTGPAVPIPDNTIGGVNIPVVVSGVGTITDLNFRFDTSGACDGTILNTDTAISHTFVGDLILRLTSPAGTSVVLVQRRGGTHENWCAGLLDEESDYPGMTSIVSASGTPVLGYYVPDDSLARFRGQNANGTWVLNVSDNASSDTGSMRRFSLVFNDTSRHTLAYAYNFDGNRIVSFHLDAPGTFLTDLPLFNLGTGEALQGLDARAFNGRLYAVGKTGTSQRLVQVDPMTGAITAISPATFGVLSGTFGGVDVNPAADRVREVDDGENNRRLNPNDGALLATDTNLAYVAGDVNAGANPNVVHLAYDVNQFNAVVTTLYGIDTGTDSLVRIGGPGGSPSPNTGQLTTIGVLGLNATGFGGFDIQEYSNGAYAVLRLSGVSNLYAIDLTSGDATPIGAVGVGTSIDGFTIVAARNALFANGVE